MRAMARMAVDRFPTAGEFADVLAAAIEGSSPGRSVITGNDVESVVVLPLKNLSGDPDDEHLSDGITEELIHRLSKVDNLHVIGRTSSFAFKNTTDDVRAIAERLQVRNILDGSVRRSANKIRVTVQLISTANDKPLWSERFDRELNDVFEIQDEISDSIVNTLQGTLLAKLPKRSRSAVSFETWENYLKGRHAWSRRTEHGIEKGLTFLRRAAAEDMEFAPPRAGLADAYVTLAIYGARPPNEVIPLANEAVAEAIAIDPESAEALTSQACIKAIYDWDWAEGEATFRNASRKAPNYSMAPHWLAMHCLIPQRRFMEASVELDRARELDPMSAAIGVSHGILEYMRGDGELATRLIREVLEFEASFALGHYFLGQALESIGEHDKAMDSFEQGFS